MDQYKKDFKSKNRTILNTNERIWSNAFSIEQFLQPAKKSHNNNTKLTYVSEARDRGE
jgi:hypothetical protein